MGVPTKIGFFFWGFHFKKGGLRMGNVETVLSH